MTHQPGLFEMASEPLMPGDPVEVKTVWGERWRCEVVEVRMEHGWPVVEVRYGRDTLTVDVSRCRRL